MAITPDEVEVIARPLMDMYEQMEIDLMTNIAKRLSLSDEITADTVADWQAKKLMEMGALRQDNIKTIAKYAGKTEEEIKSIFEKAGYKSLSADELIYDQAYKKGLLKTLPAPLESSKVVKQIFESSARNAKDKLNLINTTALESANRSYINLINQVYMETQLGIYDYNTSVRKAVQQLADKGITGINYKSATGREREDRVDVAVRRNILTSMTQTAAESQIARMQEWGADTVEVSTHFPCRPAHLPYQGSRYSVNGSSKIYKDLKTATGYGTAQGLCGINCAHTFYPYFGFISGNAKTKYYSEKSNAAAYNISQQQRKLERGIRSEKRRIIAADAMGDDDKKRECQKRLTKKKNELDQFLEDNKRTKRPAREQVFGYDRKLASSTRALGGRVKPVAKTPVAPEPPKAKKKTVDTGEPGKSMSTSWSKDAQQQFHNDQRSIMHLDHERTHVYDPKTGKKLMTVEGGERSVDYTDDQLKAMKGSVHIHNHPTGRSFSVQDLYLMDDVKIAEAQAITTKGKFIMKYPDQWPKKWREMNGAGLQMDASKSKDKIEKKYAEDLAKHASNPAKLDELKKQIHNDTMDDLLTRNKIDHWFEEWPK